MMKSTKSSYDAKKLHNLQRVTTTTTLVWRRKLHLVNRHQPIGMGSMPYLLGMGSMPFLLGKGSMPYLLGKGSMPYLLGMPAIPAREGFNAIPAREGFNAIPAREGFNVIPTTAGAECLAMRTMLSIAHVIYLYLQC